MFDLTFTVDDKGAATPLTLPIDQAVIAGWTGRDPVARDKHIAELEAIGIARPATTPIYYRVSARRLTTADIIEVCGDNSSGEVEFVLIGWQGRIFVGLGSDHTDRKVESLQRHGVQADVRQADGAGAVGARGRHRPLGPDDPALACRGSTASACSTRKARSTRMLPVQGIDRARFWRARDCPMAARCSAAPLPPRAASARPSRFEYRAGRPCAEAQLRHGYDVIVLPVRG